MIGRVTITTAKGEIYFYSNCAYNYTKNDTAQVNFVYETDISKYNIVVGLNRDKLSLSINATHGFGIPGENTFNVMTLTGGGPVRNTTVEVEYLKFNFSSEEVFVDYGPDFADIVLPCSYTMFSQNPRTSVLKLSCKLNKDINTDIKE